MNAERLPASLAGTYLMAHERQGRLRAEARDERLARPARAARSSSPRLTKRSSMFVRQAGVGATGGTD